MMWTQALLFAAIAFLSCSAATPREQPGEEVQRSAPPYEFGDLRIWPTVDTTEAFNAEAIACLRRFCLKKVKPDEPNDHWYTPDLERFGGIPPEVRYAEFDSLGDPRYPPTLLSIRETDVPDQRLLTVRWAAMDSTGVAERVRYVFDFLARRTADGIRVGSPLDHKTRQWERKTVGTIEYVISPQHRYAAQQARQQLADIDRLSRFFELPKFPITFYSCVDPTELFQIQGYQQHPLMHVFPTGGRAEGSDIVYSGNDQDVYTHEVVHLFTQRKFGERPWVLDEGLATLLAGSSEHEFAWHRANLKRYLEEEPDVDLVAICTTYDPTYINEHTNVAYAIGGVLCERILRRNGKEGLFSALAAGTDLWATLQRYDVTRETVRAEVVKELALEPVVLP